MQPWKRVCCFASDANQNQNQNRKLNPFNWSYGDVMPIKPENKARYPKDWALRSRFVRFVRARNRCEWCGAENYKPHPETGSKVILTCAHVYDHRPEAAGLLNLAALCQRCHNRHDAPMRARNRKRQLITGQLDLPGMEAR